MKRLGLQRDAAEDAKQMIREALVPVPTEQSVELMAQWQAIASNTKPKKGTRRILWISVSSKK